MDITLELGQKKALIIYGLSLEKYQEVIVKEKRALKQTELAFLAPPSQRSQCRYFNVERLVK